MELFNWRTLLFIALTASRVQDATQLVIKNLRVPAAVQSGDVSSVILDCEYDLESTPITGLVVQWFMNDVDLVYQWIYKGLPNANELFAKYIDLTYKATNDSSTMYRAMKLNNPGIELTGNYTCVVATYVDDRREKKPMLVFRTEDKLELIHKEKESENGEFVVVTCSTEGVFPSPTLDINVEGVPRSENFVQPNVVRAYDGRFSATAELEVKKDLVPDSAVITCVLELPNTGYNVSRMTVFYPGSPTTPPTTTTTLQRKMDIQVLDNAQPDTDNGGGSGSLFKSSRLMLIAVVGITVIRSSVF